MKPLALVTDKEGVCFAVGTNIYM